MKNSAQYKAGVRGANKALKDHKYALELLGGKAKPITEEQVVSSENPDTGTTISTGGEMVYVQADWKDLYREELAEEKLKAKNQVLKEVLELKLMKDEEMPIHSGIYGDSNIKPDVRNKLRQQLRASIKEMINDYSSASDRAENKYQEGTYEQ